MGDIKVSETFVDLIRVLKTSDGSAGTGLTVSCTIIKASDNTRTAGTVAELSHGWYKLTDFTNDGAGTWATEWAVAESGYTLYYPYKEFKAGGGRTEDIYDKVAGLAGVAMRGTDNAALASSLTTHDSQLKAVIATAQADLNNPDQYKADVSAVALETTVAGLNNLSDVEVWAYATRTLTDPDSYKADVSALALESGGKIEGIETTLASPDNFKADVSSIALEATLTAMKEKDTTPAFDSDADSLEAISEAIAGLNNITAASVWAVGTRTLTDAASYKADVSSLALEATLGTHDTDIKNAISGLTDVTAQQVWEYGTRALSTPADYKADVSNLDAKVSEVIQQVALTGHPVSSIGKILYDIYNSRLTSTRAGYLDQLDFNLQEAIAAIPTTAMRGTDNALLAANYVTERGTDNALLAASYTAERGTDSAATVADGWDSTLATILDNFSATRIGYLDELDFGLAEYLEDLRQKATDPAWSQDTDSLEAIREAVDTKAPANEYDTQLDANMSTRAPANEYDTEMARITANVATETKQDIIDGFHDIPSEDSADDAQMRDVVGKKSDTVAGTSVIALLKQLIVDTGTDIVADFDRHVTWIDCWSDSQAVVTITGGASDVNLPSVIIPTLPTGATIWKVILLFKCAKIKDTSASDNAINGACNIRIKKSTGAWDTDDITAYNIQDDCWAVDVSEATEIGGDAFVGNINNDNLSGEVDEAATYNLRFDAVQADGANLLLHDVAMGLRVYFY